MATRQSTSGSTASQEIIRYIQVNREKIDRFRYATGTLRLVDGRLHIWIWAEEERRDKEIDYL